MSTPIPETGPCAAWEGLLNGYLDGELDAAHVMDVERHLAGCPACAGALERMTLVRRVMSQDDVRWRAPPALRDSVIATFARERSAAAAGPSGMAGLVGRLRAMLPSLRRWSVIPSLAVLAVALLLVVLPPRGGSSLEEELVAGHVRSLLAEHLTDVASSNQHTVKPWFGGKIDFSPPVVDLAARGFPLAGGRLDYIGGRVVAALVYRRNGHVINVFVWPAGSDARVPKAFMARAHEGYTLLNWSEAGLTYWAISDLNTVELKEFQEDFLEALPK
ncbi:anti-sigma factor family protein [Xanthobacter autotrophicus]|uniref:anti-sigma factor family protein n=1 Tax=Xanthobacter autotrophicus TaxID=280 RepID=UPI0024A6F025|nr:anti-sigma factor [Xanthobacter autotrophicus]MDI4655704.1 anti-sigma factor [Xanthobacter autotrophicus]